MIRNLRNKTIKTIGAVASVAVGIELTTHLPSEGRSSQFYHDLSDKVATPLIRLLLNPEDAHNAALYFVKLGFAPTFRSNVLESSQQVSLQVKGPLGLLFPNVVGLAAGFDKNGEAIQGLMDLGFGFVEIGSVTPKPQPGNPKPRMFRLEEDLGVINRFGFNSIGMMGVEQNLIAFREHSLVRENNGVAEEGQQSSQEKQDVVHALTGFLSMIGRNAWELIFPQRIRAETSLLGVNLGKNKTSTHETKDYEDGIEKLGPYADYLVINISSPNTPGLRNLQKSEPIRRLLKAAIQKRDTLQNKPPLLVKIAPDLSLDEMKDIALAVMENNVDGILVTNTSNQRPKSLISPKSVETGGLSGLPIRDLSTECIRKMYELTEGNVFIIGIGGVGSGHDVYEKLKAGASVVQIYSRMVYEGPGLVSRIRKELSELMMENGQKRVEDVVGLDHEDIYWRKRLSRYQTSQQKNEGTIVAMSSL